MLKLWGRRRFAVHVSICSAHSDVQIYLQAQVEVQISKQSLMVKAAMSRTFPVSVLIGRDAPELLDLLNETDSTKNNLMVLTHVQTNSSRKRRRRCRRGITCPKHDPGL